LSFCASDALGVKLYGWLVWIVTDPELVIVGAVFTVVVVLLPVRRAAEADCAAAINAVAAIISTSDRCEIDFDMR